MRTYRQLKEDFEITKEIAGRQAETLNKISEILQERNVEIAKLKCENRYLNRKISDYENYLDKHKEIIAKKNSI